MTLLKVEQLVVERPRRGRWLGHRPEPEKVIDHVSFTVQPGQIMGVVGESGSGKMALTRALVKLEKAAGGQVWLKEQEILSLSEYNFRPFRRQIQPVFSDTFGALDPRMTVERTVKEVVVAHFPDLKPDAVTRRAAAAMQRVRLPLAYKGSFPHELEPGQRQMVALARALVLEPDLLICHDLTHTLDIAEQAEILNLLKDLRDELGIGCLFVAHDLAVADHMSDHILILHRGKIVESASPEEIVRHPQHDYTRKLVSSTTTMQ